MAEKLQRLEQEEIAQRIKIKTAVELREATEEATKEELDKVRQNIIYELQRNSTVRTATKTAYNHLFSLKRLSIAMRETALSEEPIIPEGDCNELSQKTDEAAIAFKDSLPGQFAFIQGENGEVLTECLSAKQAVRQTVENNVPEDDPELEQNVDNAYDYMDEMADIVEQVSQFKQDVSSNKRTDFDGFSTEIIEDKCDDEMEKIDKVSAKFKDQDPEEYQVISKRSEKLLELCNMAAKSVDQFLSNLEAFVMHNKVSRVPPEEGTEGVLPETEGEPDLANQKKLNETLEAIEIV